MEGLLYSLRQKNKEIDAILNINLYELRYGVVHNCAEIPSLINMPVNETTKKFKQQVEMLIQKGMAESHKEIIDTLKWNKASMSTWFNQRVNIPAHRYAEFEKVYGLENESKQSTLPTEVYSKDEHITLQKKYIELQNDHIQLQKN